MWICLNDAFFSIVQNNREPLSLVVRARRKGDIECHFLGSHVMEWPERDYAYRAFVGRDQVASMLAKATYGIDYTNFKASVGDDDLHNAYLEVWHAMASLQKRLEASGSTPANS